MVLTDIVCLAAATLLQAILRAHREALQAGQAELLEKEVLFGDDLERLLAAHPPSNWPPPPGGDGDAKSGNGNGAQAAGANAGNGGGLAVPAGART